MNCAATPGWDPSCATIPSCSTTLPTGSNTHRLVWPRNSSLPSNMIKRVKFFSERARSAWLQLQLKSGEFTAETRLEFLRILKDAANAIACLTSVPLTERRFLIDFPERAISLKMPGLAGGFIDMIVPAEAVEPDWENWLANWKASYDTLLKQPNVPLTLSTGRLPVLRESHR